MKTIKERAKAIIFEHESDIATAFSRAFALVQEIANAPEPNPSMWQIFGDDWSSETTFLAVAEYYRNEGCKVVAYYATPPAPSNEKYQEKTNEYMHRFICRPPSKQD